MWLGHEGQGLQHPLWFAVFLWKTRKTRFLSQNFFSVQACFRDSLGPLELEGACLPFYHLFNQLKVHAQREGSTKQVGD